MPGGGTQRRGPEGARSYLENIVSQKGRVEKVVCAGCFTRQGMRTGRTICGIDGIAEAMPWYESLRLSPSGWALPHGGLKGLQMKEFYRSEASAAPPKIRPFS